MKKLLTLEALRQIAKDADVYKKLPRDWQEQADHYIQLKERILEKLENQTEEAREDLRKARGYVVFIKNRT